jgi:hypothetical protein
VDETIRTAAISPLRQRSIDDMNVRRFSRATQHNYIRDVGRFATFLGRSPDTATTDDVRRSRSPASRRTANHPVAIGVNRDASHFCIGPGIGESALHGQAVPGGWSGSAGPRHARYAGGHARRSRRRNRPGRGRNNYRSAPERGIPHTGTAGQTPRRRDWIGGHPVDERHDSRNTDAACVPGTV